MVQETERSLPFSTHSKGKITTVLVSLHLGSTLTPRPRSKSKRLPLRLQVLECLLWDEGQIVRESRQCDSVKRPLGSEFSNVPVTDSPDNRRKKGRDRS